MNNDAFRKLVKERANIKSTKEIAREAVDNEFRKRENRRRGRGGRGGGSSDEDYDDSDDDEKRKWQDRKRRKREEEQKNDRNDGVHQVDPNKYRDRAQERREGTLQVETYGAVPVKGLDVNLARSSRRQLQKTKQLQNNEEDGVESTRKTELAKDRKQAEELIESDDSLQPVSSLGGEMLKFLRSHYLSKRRKRATISPITVTQGGLFVQRSNLTFSLQADPRDFVRSWETPREQTYANTSASYTKASPISAALIAQMKKALEKQNTTIDLKHSSLEPPKRENLVSQKDESDDEDIFGSVGDDYDPNDGEVTEASEEEGESFKLKNRSSVAKGAIFDDLVTPTNGGHTSISKNITENVGGHQNAKDIAATVAATASSGKLVGFSEMTQSEGMYGDDMDVDFDERMEERDESGDDKRTKKKHKKKKIKK